MSNKRLPEHTHKIILCVNSIPNKVVYYGTLSDCEIEFYDLLELNKLFGEKEYILRKIDQPVTQEEKTLALIKNYIKNNLKIEVGRQTNLLFAASNHVDIRLMIENELINEVTIKLN